MRKEKEKETETKDRDCKERKPCPGRWIRRWINMLLAPLTLHKRWRRMVPVPLCSSVLQSESRYAFVCLAAASPRDRCWSVEVYLSAGGEHGFQCCRETSKQIHKCGDTLRINLSQFFIITIVTIVIIIIIVVTVVVMTKLSHAEKQRWREKSYKANRVWNLYTSNKDIKRKTIKQKRRQWIKEKSEHWLGMSRVWFVWKAVTCWGICDASRKMLNIITTQEHDRKYSYHRSEDTNECAAPSITS